MLAWILGRVNFVCLYHDISINSCKELRVRQEFYFVGALNSDDDVIDDVIPYHLPEIVGGGAPRKPPRYSMRVKVMGKGIKFLA